MKPEPEGFAEFWSTWRTGPVRISDGRGKARLRYKAMIEEGFSPRDIIDGWKITHWMPLPEPPGDE